MSWYFILFNIIFGHILLGIETVIQMIDLQSALELLIGFLVLGMVIPSMVASARWLHDQGHSNLWLLMFILIIGLMKLLPELLSGIYALAMVLPTIAVLVRRLHDQGRSGWWLLIQYIPIVGSIILLIFLCQDSEPNRNEYGQRPKDQDSFCSLEVMVHSLNFLKGRSASIGSVSRGS